MSDVDDAVRNFSRLLASRRGSTGIQPKPIIDVSESAFEPQGTDLGINPPPVGGLVPSGGGGGGILPPPPVCPCSPRHLSILFRAAGQIQTFGCSPNAGLLSWNCGGAGIPYPPTNAYRLEVDFDPCGTPFYHSFYLQYSSSLCTSYESCSGGGDPVACDWGGGINIGISGHDITIDLSGATFHASVDTTRNCSGTPTHVTAYYDGTSNGYPSVPPPIHVPDWCAAVGTQLFSYNSNWDETYSQGLCECFGGSKTVYVQFGLFVYIDVT